MRRVIMLAAVPILLLAAVSTAAASDPPTVDPPATVEKVSGGNSVELVPGLVFSAVSGSYTGHITFVPIYDPLILPHGQVENSWFDFNWTGPITLSVGGQPLAVLAAPVPPATSVSGRMMVHLHEPLPNDPGLAIDGIVLPVTPYSITIALDEPAYLLPSIFGTTIEVTRLQIVKGRLFILK